MSLGPIVDPDVSDSVTASYRVIPGGNFFKFDTVTGVLKYDLVGLAETANHIE